MNGKWEARNERRVYESDWVTVDLYDVELPDGNKFEGHIVRCGDGAVKVVVFDENRGVLCLWRHRLTGNEWGWELPGGRIEAKEAPAKAAAREVLEETGWRPGPLTKLTTVQPFIGVADHPAHLYWASGAEWVGPGPDATEAADISWIPVPTILEIMGKGEMSDGSSQLAILLAIRSGVIR